MQCLLPELLWAWHPTRACTPPGLPCIQLGHAARGLYAGSQHALCCPACVLCREVAQFSQFGEVFHKLVMPFIGVKQNRAMWTSRPSLDIEEALIVLLHVLQGVCALQSVGMVHTGGWFFPAQPARLGSVSHLPLPLPPSHVPCAMARYVLLQQA